MSKLAHSSDKHMDEIERNARREDEGTILGECDCCGKKNRELSFCIAYGIETYACDECRSFDPFKSGS